MLVTEVDAGLAHIESQKRALGLAANLLKRLPFVGLRPSRSGRVEFSPQAEVAPAAVEAGFRQFVWVDYGRQAERRSVID
jgi:hypothetical protein